MYKALVVLLLVVFPLSISAAENLDRPNVKPGDKWNIQTTVEVPQKNDWRQSRYEMTVVRAGSSGILVSMQERNSKRPAFEVMFGADWSRFRSINGEETVVEKPFNFPLAQGKTWEVQYAEDHPNKDYKNSSHALKYTVIGWEDVEVPAGKFKALKIEADGRWKGELAPVEGSITGTRKDEGGSTTVTSSRKVIPKVQTGRIYRAYWYAPQVKTFVKTIDEGYTTGGNLSRRTTQELESYKVAP